MAFICSVCNEEHPDAPLSWGPDAPDAWVAASEAQRSEGELTSDLCILPIEDGAGCFVRGRIEIPVQAAAEPFAWLVWVKVQPDALKDMHEKWFALGRELTPPYEGALANQLSIYKQPTLNLPVRLYTRPVGERPFVEITGWHQLAVEQSNGITAERVQQIAEILSLILMRRHRVRWTGGQHRRSFLLRQMVRRAPASMRDRVRP